MEVKLGYKQTEAGFIPEGWKVKRLDALADIRSGGTPSTGEPRFWDGDIPWCTPTDITALNGHKYLGETARMITQLGLKASSAEMIPAHSVVMTSRATIGECAINAVPVSTNQGFKNFVPFATTDVDFLYYLLGTQKQGFISLCGGSTFLEIGKTQLAAYQVRLPATLAEQRAIAAALSDVDGLLGGLDRLIAKKRDLKQAAMQQLLTGQTRLPGYSGEWETKRLGDRVTRLPKTKRLSSDGELEGRYPFFTNSTQPVDRYLDEKDFDQEAIIANTGGVAYFDYFNGPFAAMADCMVLSAQDNVKWLFYLLKTLEPFINNTGFTGSGIKHLDKEFFFDLNVHIATSPEEQAAIAGTLTAMDSELGALVTRRDKTRALKHGMMQELLTGRIRLVEAEALHA